MTLVDGHDESKDEFVEYEGRGSELVPQYTNQKASIRLPALYRPHSDESRRYHEHRAYLFLAEL